MENDLVFKFDNGATYELESDSIKDNDWIAHLQSKGWCDFNDFIPIYFQWLRMNGIKSIEILTHK